MCAFYYSLFLSLSHRGSPSRTLAYICFLSQFSFGFCPVWHLMIELSVLLGDREGGCQVNKGGASVPGPVRRGSYCWAAASVEWMPEDNTAASSIRKVSVFTGRYFRMTTVTWETHYQLSPQYTRGPSPWLRTWYGQFTKKLLLCYCIIYTQFRITFHWLWIKCFTFKESFGQF